MSRYMVRLRWILSACVAMSLVAVTLTPGAMAAPAQGRRGVARLASATPGTRLWVSYFNGTNGMNFTDVASLGVSPDGTRVFLAGGLDDQAGSHYGTVAYDAASGKRLWVRVWDRGGCPGYDPQYNYVHALGVSPDGTKVFVTGEGGGCPDFPASYYATIAYDAATGSTLWEALYTINESDGYADATALGVSPDGTTVFVTGWTWVWDKPDGPDFTTVAYDTSTGDRRWVSGYYGPGIPSGSYAQHAALDVSPDGTKVFVTGHSVANYSTTVAYDAASGAQLWARRYGNGFPQAIGVSSDGTKVFVTGYETGATGGYDYFTIAYAASTGAMFWARRYNGPANGNDMAWSLGVSPDGKRVFVAGASPGRTSGGDYVTIAYAAWTGAKLWARRYNGPANGNDMAWSLGVSPDGKKVFVTGDVTTAHGPNIATVAYGTSLGAWLGVARYRGFGGRALAVSPDGTRLFVAGTSSGAGTSYGVTIAYAIA